MANEILKGIVHGINKGVNKSPFPNPIGTVVSGVKGISGGLNGFRKKQEVVAKKNFRKKQKLTK